MAFPRYVCGYVYTGNTVTSGKGASRAQSDASHAWLQLYVPNAGWKGFDPTNGVLASTNHIRVAYGRHYRDVTPTSGTLYSSAQETMTIDVQVVELPNEAIEMKTLCQPVGVGAGSAAFSPSSSKAADLSYKGAFG